jgi:hypothetical protein
MLKFTLIDEYLVAEKGEMHLLGNGIEICAERSRETCTRSGSDLIPGRCPG